MGLVLRTYIANKDTIENGRKCEKKSGLAYVVIER